MFGKNGVTTSEWAEVLHELRKLSMQMNTFESLALVENLPCMREEQDSIPNSALKWEWFHSGYESKRIIEVQSLCLHVEFKATLFTWDHVSKTKQKQKDNAYR